MKPTNAAPIPAMCPIGAIARAFIFPKRNPIVKNCSAIKVSSTGKLGFTLDQKNTTYTSDITQKPNRAKSTNLLEPNLSTNVPLRKVAAPTVIASPAKI